MIKANELCVGNWIYGLVKNKDFGKILNKIPFKIKDGEHIDIVCNNTNQSDFIECIPLTTEILEKCGFQKKDIFFEKKPLGIYINTETIDIDVWYIGAVRLKTKHLKYLHQLQNLYFALTGEELTVNI
jgi:hypothetical protein